MTGKTITNRRAAPRATAAFLYVPMLSFQSSGYFSMNAVINCRALQVVDDHQLHTSRTHVVFGSRNGTVLSDHNLRNPIKQHGAAAHIARR